MLLLVAVFLNYFTLLNYSRLLSAHHMTILGAALYDDTMLSCNSFSQGSHWVREELSMCSSHGMFKHLVHNASSITSNVQVDQVYSTTLVSFSSYLQYIYKIQVHVFAQSRKSVQLNSFFSRCQIHSHTSKLFGTGHFLLIYCFMYVHMHKIFG